MLGSRDAAADPAAKGYPEYDPNQLRDDQGRWARLGGAMEALLANRRGGATTTRQPTSRARLQQRLNGISPLLDYERMKDFTGRFIGEDRSELPQLREQRRQELEAFLDTLDSRGLGLTPEEKTRFAFIYAAEGGMMLKGGVMRSLFDSRDFRERLKREGLSRSRAAITPENLPAYYRVAEEHLMRGIGIDARARLAEIRDEKLRIAFIDTLFMGGATGGAESIREALSTVRGSQREGIPDILGENGIIKKEAFERFKAIANGGSPQEVRDLKKELAAARIAYRIRHGLDPAAGRINYLAEDDPSP